MSTSTGYYRITAARLLLATYGDSYGEANDMPHIRVKKLSAFAPIQACLNECRVDFKWQKEAPPEEQVSPEEQASSSKQEPSAEAMDKARAYITEKLREHVNPGYSLYEPSEFYYEPVETTTGQVIGHDTVFPLLNNESIISVGPLPGASGPQVKGFVVVFVGVGFKS